MLIYQVYYIFTIEGLNEDEPTDGTTTSTTTTPPPTDGTTSSTVASTDTTTTTNSNMDLSKLNNSYSSLSLTDRNLLFLNDRVNILNNNYLDLSMNLVKLQNQMNESSSNKEEATDLVGNTPVAVT